MFTLTSHVVEPWRDTSPNVEQDASEYQEWGGNKRPRAWWHFQAVVHVEATERLIPVHHLHSCYGHA